MDSIIAPTSCPGITGSFTIGLRPKNVFRSEPQKPTYLIFTRTSPGLRAVSYTHLDVYKRQGLFYAYLVETGCDGTVQTGSY